MCIVYNPKEPMYWHRRARKKNPEPICGNLVFVKFPANWSGILLFYTMFKDDFFKTTVGSLHLCFGFEDLNL